MTEQLKRIEEKLRKLKKIDSGFNIFGAGKHKYKLNSTISLEQLRKFEQSYNIILPAEYVEFLTTLGNGGAGPYYGLEPFENCLFDDLDYKRSEELLNPSKSFLHTAPWNMDFDTDIEEDENEDEYESAYGKFQDQYYSNEHMNGAIAICNFGCGVSLNLVMNGEEHGNIWTDDRASDNGIYPSREFGNENTISFLKWYELWLDNSLKEIDSKFPEQSKPSNTTIKEKSPKQKPWWKLW